ncbi:transcription initiation factor IIA large subunit [Martiniozyma asiatica (nom. inval.)]|nr:hypothetical protein DAMA08_027070 [Martiniozyma asiatica]GMM31531.1 transcription initiation factor IIA large subunit [Martiniozyma asiatica]
MSNQATATLYEAIINSVLDESRQDFEESGIEIDTLTELGRLWRQKLSEARVADFPWDSNGSIKQFDNDSAQITTSEEQPIQNLTSAINSNGSISVTGNLPLALESESGSATTAIATERELLTQEPKIKQENNDELHVASLDIANEGTPLAGLGVPELDLGLDLGLGQADGIKQSTNFELEMDIDKDQWEELKWKISNKKSKSKSKLKLKGKNNIEGKVESKTTSMFINQTDGLNDDDVNEFELNDELDADSDQINSDLDDPSELSSNESVDDEENVMLCLYERVQRVRNRWKCSLKEGIAHIDGKDYVFNKATGDSEW